MKNINMFQGRFVTQLPLGTQQKKKTKNPEEIKASGFRCEPALQISNIPGRRKISFKVTDLYVTG